MNKIELFKKYIAAAEMCKGTALEDTPWKCIKIYGGKVDGEPEFTLNLDDYEFAVAIVEDNPVFAGDKLYSKVNKQEYQVDSSGNITRHGYLFKIKDHAHNLSFEKPQQKRTFMLNGVNLPCPTKNNEGYRLNINGIVYRFDTNEDRDLVERHIIDILRVASNDISIS